MPTLIRKDEGFLIPDGPYLCHIASIKITTWKQSDPASDPCYEIDWMIDEATRDNEEWVGKLVRFTRMGLAKNTTTVQKMVDAIAGNDTPLGMEILLDDEPFDTEDYERLMERPVGVNFEQRHWEKAGKSGTQNDFRKGEPFFPAYLWDSYRENL